MNILPLVRTLGKVLILPVPKLLFEPISNTITRRIHQLSISGNLTRLQTMNTTCLSAPRALLQPVLPMLNPVCGLKVRGKLELRCRKCYYVARQGRLYVMCKDHPRHKQTQMMKRTYKTWKLTHATQGKIRPW